MNKFTKANGITLLALVITIIVLLILAGITISNIVGENGIIAKTIKAGNRTEIGKVVEKMKLEASDYLLNKDAGNTESDNNSENNDNDGNIGFVNYLIDKGYISNKDYYDKYSGFNGDIYDYTVYVLKVDKLFTEKLKLGKGSINDGYIYVIRFKDTGESEEYYVEYYNEEHKIDASEKIYIKERGNNTLPLPDDFYIYEDEEETIIIAINDTYIGSGSGYGCGGSYRLVYNSDGTERTKLTVPEGVVSIKENVFEILENVSSISLPNSLKFIGDNAFDKSIRLTNINIPNGVESIGKCAFSGTGIKDIILLNGATKIESFAFGECNGLTKVIIPEGVTSIEEYAFFVFVVVI